MSWNPSDQNKDPWGRDKNKSQGPPDLDALLREYKNKIMAALGGKKSSFSNNNQTIKTGGFFVILVLIAILILWIISGIFIVSPAERAVIQRFGRYVETVGPGPHWIARFIESKTIINVQRVATYTYQAEMLTKDENIVSAAVSVMYRISDPSDFLFNGVDTEANIEQATASALRQAVGTNTLDDLLTTGRELVRNQVTKQLQQILESYKSGILITDVTLQAIKPPEEVTAAFDDVVKAREDKQAYVNRAVAYKNQVNGAAQGQRARILQESEAYRQEVVLEAYAATAAYLAILPEYRKAPNVTKQRMYLTTMETVLGNSNTVFLDQTQGSSPIVYLPLDKMQSQPGGSMAPVTNLEKSSLPLDMQKATDASGVSDRTSYPTRGTN